MEKENDQGAPEAQTDGEVIDSTQTEEEESSETEEQAEEDPRLKELQDQIADLTGKLKRATKQKSEPKKESKTIKSETGELDWGQKAYLRSEGIEPSEFDFVQEQIEESNLPLEKLLSNNYFKSQLQERRNAAAVEKATPGNTRGATKSSRAEPAYWVDKPFSDVPDELKRDVLNLKIAKESGPRHSSQRVVYGTNS